MSKILGLINVLFDESAREDERHDAAMDLGKYNEDMVLSALITIASNDMEDELILDSCYESIVRIWKERNSPDISIYNKLSDKARNGVYEYIEAYCPHWVGQYRISAPPDIDREGF